MSFDTVAEFLDLMPHTITLRKYAEDDGYGESSYAGTTTQLRARVVTAGTRATPTFVRDSGGEERLSRVVVYVAGTPGIDPKDQITLPNGTQPPILAVDSFPDEDGAHHEVVYFA